MKRESKVEENVRKAREALKERGVLMKDIGELVLHLQQPYYADITLEECVHHAEWVLRKREVQNAILTGIALDQLAEQKKLPSPLQEIVANDEGLYGCDEILALSIVNVYGSIGLTNFGYLDKMKPGIVAKLNQKSETNVQTFLDDIVCAIAASASSRIAHSKGEQD